MLRSAVQRCAALPPPQPQPLIHTGLSCAAIAAVAATFQVLTLSQESPIEDLGSFCLGIATVVVVAQATGSECPLMPTAKAYRPKVAQMGLGLGSRCSGHCGYFRPLRAYCAAAQSLGLT